MVQKLQNRKRAFLILEIAVIGLLGWTVLTSNSVMRKDVQASNATAKAGKLKKHQSTRRVPREGQPPTSFAALQAAPGTPNLCLGFDFESGAQGFTVVPVSGATLWHVANNVCRASLTGHSTPQTFYYGQEVDAMSLPACNYNTGAKNASNLISPSISLAGLVAPYEIGFNYLLFVESSSSFDTTFVDLSTDNGSTWTPILGKGNLVNDNQWHNKAADVTAAVGSATSIKLRFRFDSVDNLVNSSTGWHIDDVVVCGAFNACVQDDSSRATFKINSNTGAYQFDSCTGTTLSGVGTLSIKGLLITLQDNRPDRRVQAKLDKSVMKGSASIQLFSPTRTFTILDRNLADNTCRCH